MATSPTTTGTCTSGTATPGPTSGRCVDRKESQAHKDHKALPELSDPKDRKAPLDRPEPPAQTPPSPAHRVLRASRARRVALDRLEPRRPSLGLLGRKVTPDPLELTAMMALLALLVLRVSRATPVMWVHKARRTGGSRRRLTEHKVPPDQPALRGRRATPATRVLRDRLDQKDRRVLKGHRAFRVFRVNLVKEAEPGAAAVTGSVNGTPTALTLWKGTQVQFDAIGTKDPNTIYTITEGGDAWKPWTPTWTI